MNATCRDVRAPYAIRTNWSRPVRSAPTARSNEYCCANEPLIVSSRRKMSYGDSGHRAELYAVGSDGRTLATLTLAGVEARDWEALAAGRDDRGRPALFVGDIGDNQGVWPSVTVYRAAEPARLRDATVPAQAYRLRYPDGPRDAEALLVDPGSNRLYVASKEEAVEWAKRAPISGPGMKTEIRRVPSIDEFPQDNEWIQKEIQWKADLAEKIAATAGQSEATRGRTSTTAR